MKLNQKAGESPVKHTLDQVIFKGFRTNHIVHTTLRNPSILLFIDGLDEFEGTTQQDHGVVVEFLKSWATSAPFDIKLCVSSREQNVFMNAFPHEQRFRLQDLTRRDMDLYVRDKIKFSDDDEACNESVTKIVERGNGIFLWVVLVVKSLRERLADGHNLCDLEDEVNSLPEEVESIFRYLLEKLSKVERRKAYEIFAMVSTLMVPNRGFRPGRLRALQYSFLADLKKDPLFAVRELFEFSDLKPLERNIWLQQACKQVNRYCKGLVETIEVDGDHCVFDFTRRSISESLEEQRGQADTRYQVNDFDANDVLAHLNIAHLRTLQ